MRNDLDKIDLDSLEIFSAGEVAIYTGCENEFTALKDKNGNMFLLRFLEDGSIKKLREIDVNG